ncbi:hypothetical protein TNCV_411691 [Trichonephila clavipes]|nr:hypothetical protein TNCV_411691 [Trichonephila clavipes]
MVEQIIHMNTNFSEDNEGIHIIQTVPVAGASSPVTKYQKMAALTETWITIEIRNVIRFLPLKKNSPAEIHLQRVVVYNTSVMSRKQV